MTPLKHQLYRRLLSYAFRYKAFLIVSIFGFALFAAMEAALVATLEFLIQRLEGRPSEPIFMLSSEITSSIYFVPIAVIVLSIFRGVGSFLGNFFMSRVGLNVVNALRKQVFSHMLFLPQSYYDQRNSGELVSLIIYNIEQVTGATTNSIKILLRDGFSVAFFLYCMLAINWQLTLIFFIIAPILGGIIYVAAKYFRKTSLRIQTSVGKITHISTETFQGIKLVKSYLGEKYEKERFESAANNNLTLSTKYERVKALQTPILHIVIAIALAIVFFLVMRFWDGTAGQAVVYVSFAGMIAKPFRQLATINAVIQRGMAAAETIFSTIDSQTEEDTGKQTLTNAEGKIEFINAGFSYDDSEQAIDNFNLVIQPGETVALVGESGSGKTTIASLLLRFYNLNTGEIKIDGVSLKDLSIESLRQNITLVNQQTVLFNNSVRANISYGQDSDTIEDAAILDAASNAYAKHFIEDLDSGFDTHVGEDGDNLSGGQRQRIAIARGLLKNAPILILDEATSALDNESEKQIQNALETLKEGRTTLIIAHRLSTIETADRIIVLEKGKIVEEGNHSSLLKKGGEYAKLHNSELSQT